VKKGEQEIKNHFSGAETLPSLMLLRLVVVGEKRGVDEVPAACEAEVPLGGRKVEGVLEALLVHVQ
jgi:hypothetical protein